MSSIFRVWGLGFRAGLGAVKPTTVLLLQRRWADAVRELNSECAARRGDVCLSDPAFLVAVFACSVSGDWVFFLFRLPDLLAYLRNFPETDQDATGSHGVLGPGSDMI